MRKTFAFFGSFALTGLGFALIHERPDQYGPTVGAMLVLGTTLASLWALYEFWVFVSPWDEQEAK